MADESAPRPNRSMLEIQQAVIALLTQIHRDGQESLRNVNWLHGGDGVEWNVAEVFQAYSYAMMLLVIMTAEVEAAQAAGRHFSVTEYIQRQAADAVLRAAGTE